MLVRRRSRRIRLSIAETPAAGGSKRPFGVRLYLTIAFAAVALIAAGLSYLLLTGSTDSAASQRAADITVGRAVSLADRVAAHAPKKAQKQFATINDPGFSSWVFGRHRQLLTSWHSRGVSLSDVPDRAEAVTAA